MEQSNILTLKNISKRFGVVQALDNVSFEVRRGEVLALVGENGAGKSTLMKILTGIYTKDSGEIFVEGKPVSISSAAVARSLGIAQVYQQAELILEATVAENIYTGDKTMARRGVVRWKELYQRADELLQRYGIQIDARKKCKTLSTAQRQLVAIARTLQQNPKLLILDEPTAVLSDKEVSILFELIQTLRRERVTIIYISHRLEEIFTLADRVAVMRNGEYVCTLDNVDLTKEQLISHMLGRSMNAMFPEANQRLSDEVVLEVKNLSNPKLHNISFKIYKGEIVGLAGLVGAGRTELARAIYGLDRIDAGEIYIRGKRVIPKNPAVLLRNGVFLAPEDRKGQGLVLSRPIKENITMANMWEFTKLGCFQRRAEQERTDQLFAELRIKAPDTSTLARNLSGGNQQKVVIAKAICMGPDILIVDEPTQGIDVGSKSEIYFILEDLRKKGVSILMISSEMNELQGLCQRIIVMRNGRIVGEAKDNLGDNSNILNLMYRSETDDA